MVFDINSVEFWLMYLKNFKENTEKVSKRLEKSIQIKQNNSEK